MGKVIHKSTDLTSLVGTFRRFGKHGPAYEVLASPAHLNGGEPKARIRVLQTGEVLEYPITKLLKDPRES